MTVNIFLLLLTILATVTALVTEVVKTFLEAQKINYASNVVVLVVAIVVGMGGTALYYVNFEVPFTALNSVYLALMGVANWIGAMVGYDKIKQAIEQIGGVK